VVCLGQVIGYKSGTGRSAGCSDPGLGSTFLGSPGGPGGIYTTVSSDTEKNSLGVVTAYRLEGGILFSLPLSISAAVVSASISVSNYLVAKGWYHGALVKSWTYYPTCSEVVWKIRGYTSEPTQSVASIYSEGEEIGEHVSEIGTQVTPPGSGDTSYSLGSYKWLSFLPVGAVWATCADLCTLENGEARMHTVQPRVTCTLTFYQTYILTNDPTGVTQTAATSGGIIYTHDETISARGVCWALTHNPTTANSKTTDGTGDGEYTSSITGLLANRTYYVRAYATNETSTVYGAEKTIVTLP
jgi:hypothetical protein